MRTRSILETPIPRSRRLLRLAGWAGAALSCVARACGGEPSAEDDDLVTQATSAVTTSSGPLRVSFQETNATSDLYYERLAATFPNEPLRYLLNGDAVIENTSSQIVSLSGATVTFTGEGGRTALFSGAALLNSRNDDDASYIMGGGWNRDGKSWATAGASSPRAPSPAAGRPRWPSRASTPRRSLWIPPSAPMARSPWI